MDAIAATLPEARALERSEDWPQDLATARLTAGRVKLTRRAGLHVLLGLSLYAAGSNVHASLVILLAGLMLATVGWAWITVRGAARRVEAARRLPLQAISGAPTPVHLWLRGPGTGAVVVRDELTGVIAAVDSLAPGAHLTASSWLSRGGAVGGRVHVDLVDRFGIARCCAVGEVPSACDILPAALDVRVGVDDLARATTAQQGAAQRSAAGAETVGTREYRAGDRPRTVHWRATARHGQLVVRELADDARPTVRIAIGGGIWSRPALDRAAVVAATVADEAARAGLVATVACDAAARTWGQTARRHLALTPPHVGAEARELAPPPEGADDVVIRLSMQGAQVRGHMDRAGQRHDLGALSCDADGEEVKAWLAQWSRP